jgi:catechol 2,3-dioxygenase-like lactoylglutathione lyase family enzyme
MTVQRMDNVLLVVDDLKAATTFFAELGLELEGETTVEDSGLTASSSSTASEATSP